MCYIFIDESGDLGFRGSNFLILSALFIEKQKPLDRIIKNMRRYKFKKELKGVSEIKANKSKDSVRNYMLGKFNEASDARVYFIVLEKNRVCSDYLINNKHKLYNYVAGKLAKNIVLEDIDVEIRIDRSKGKQMLQKDFNQYFIRNLEEQSTHIKTEVHHNYSHSYSGLQFADMLAWACFQKFEHDNPKYINLIDGERREAYYVWD